MHETNIKELRTLSVSLRYNRYHMSVLVVVECYTQETVGSPRSRLADYNDDQSRSVRQH